MYNLQNMTFPSVKSYFFINVFEKSFLWLRREINSLLETDFHQISQVLLSQCHAAWPSWYRFCSAGVWQQTGLRKWSPSVLLEGLDHARLDLDRPATWHCGTTTQSEFPLWSRPYPVPDTFPPFIPFWFQGHTELTYYTMKWDAISLITGKQNWKLCSISLTEKFLKIQNWTQLENHYKSRFISLLITIRDDSW